MGLASVHYPGLSTNSINQVKSKFKAILDDTCFLPSFAHKAEDNLITANPINFCSTELKGLVSRDREFIIGRSHGDLHTKNVLKDSIGAIWVVDWRHFTTTGHFAMDFSRLESEIIACIDFSEADAIQLGSILTEMLQNGKILNYDELKSDNYSSDVLKALCACIEIQKLYKDSLSKCNISLDDDRVLGEYRLGLFLNLISAASRTTASTLGGEISLFYAGLLVESVRRYSRMTF